jgi:lipopolysaccharide/colanic/teichoic acid biosynthesis glycosyltransferase
VSELAFTSLSATPLRVSLRAMPTVRSSAARLDSIERAKRIRDLTLCVVIAPLVLLLGLVLALCVRLETGGPVLITRQRSGRGGRTFQMLRFRTRFVIPEGTGRPATPFGPGRRAGAYGRGSRTAVGRVLHATRLVNLPALFNVITGEMALVGPRPRRYHADCHRLWHTAPLEVRPGLTGPCRVAGRKLDRDEETRLDIGYVRSQNTAVDVGIVLSTLRVVLSGARILVKRVFDIVVAASLLILLAPCMALIAWMVWRTSQGPVLFRQLRVGVDGRPFHILKFRTMCSDAEAVLRSDPALHAAYVANDFKLPLGIDPRITPIGLWLRRTSLDELPQLWNVLRGDMSLVGPRPVVPDEVAHYGHRADTFLSVLPGVTGLWQVCGRSDLPYPERCDVELDYVRTWSLSRDLVILYRTVGAVVSGRGAN